MRILGWTLLAALLASLLAAAFIHERAGWPGFAAGEATPLMQAASLVHDRDLAYDRHDYDRFVSSWRGGPTDLELVSGSQGRRITFDAPLPYALWLAPFLALWPRNGFALANAVLLACVCLLAALTLERVSPEKRRPRSAWQVTFLVFGSALFAEVFRAGGAVFLFAVTLAGFCLLVRGGGSPGRYALAGALLAIPLTVDPLYGVLLAAAFFLPATRRWPVAAGSAASLAVLAGSRWLAGGGLPGLAASWRFTGATGYPLVDFPASAWPSTIARLAAGVAEPAASWDVELRLWSLVDLVAGRSIGLLPYFAPLVLIALSCSLREHRRPLATVAAMFAVLVLVLRPFDVTGGLGVVNGLFLPVYGLLWLTLDGRREAWRAWLGVALGLGMGALSLGNLWRDPGAPPTVAGQGPSHVTPTAEKILPFETTQRRLPAGAVAEQDGLEVRVLAGDVWDERYRGRWVLAGGFAELLIGSEHPLGRVRLDFDDGAPEHLAVRGGRIDGSLGSGTPGGVPRGVRIVPGGVRRRHRVPWSGQRLYLYRLSFELPRPASPLAFRLAGEAADAEAP